MSDSKPEALIVSTKDKPRIWSVTVGKSYVASFYGADAKWCAIDYATGKFRSHSVQEPPQQQKAQFADKSDAH
jgi:hypothetical protein